MVVNTASTERLHLVIDKFLTPELRELLMNADLKGDADEAAALHACEI